MNPSGINSFDPNFMKVTFTLANAVSQFAASNNGPWEKFEKKIRDYTKIICGSQTCRGTLYLLTGRSENGLNGVPKPHVTSTFTVISNDHHDRTQLNQTQKSVIDLKKRLKAAASTTNLHLFPGNTNCARKKQKTIIINRREINTGNRL